ncbi:hypothetical protein SERLA73DRAFT_141139 [Serpula lacrymans var. lacrymans S7.3]|uniref:Uncharacterized protein n=2 Tax=Serpula lacrymans var. lacrymans TaxID=341189 RepID=F8Q5X7_SERL3|nr:uncharacterized protein SERLADRAFT_474034 [Serpula lacrymans var. lacrymans S7.9]EGN96015.1 hypothetical protein SERLA73DRAFT_141139 [Serpula lacrymans var. lacrymans S7.3]EGO21537.1 hypothetical protein SERLADRAFT_474034 [Serpula lacrymans var. lacrymans S7.9]
MPSTSSLSTFAGLSDDLEVPMEDRVYDAVFFLDSDLNPVTRVPDRKSDQFSPDMLPTSHDFSFEMR